MAPNALSDAAVAGLRAIAHDLGAPMLVQRLAEPGATPDGDVYASCRDGNAWQYARATDPRVAAFLEAWTPETAAALADEVLRLRADAARLDWLDETRGFRARYYVGDQAWALSADGESHGATLRDAIDAAMREEPDHA